MVNIGITTEKVGAGYAGRNGRGRWGYARAITVGTLVSARYGNATIVNNMRVCKSPRGFFGTTVRTCRNLPLGCEFRENPLRYGRFAGSQ